MADEEEDRTDLLPAAHHSYKSLGTGRRRRMLVDPALDVEGFLDSELFVGDLESIQKHLWYAGSKRLPSQLHLQLAMGREIIIADRMDLHLIWDDNSNNIFLKPLPRYLLEPSFWRRNLRCSGGCACGESEDAIGDGGVGRSVDKEALATVCRKRPRQVALGFIYSYACLISSECDFILANERSLLPCADDTTIKWSLWKKLVREVIRSYSPDKVHPRFIRAELRLSRINTIVVFTRLSSFNPYIRGWRSYRSLFQQNLTWLAAVTVFLAVVMTAMQLGLATDRLQRDANFQRASYGFTVFSILAPICAFGLVVLAALFNLIRDIPWLFRDLSALYRKPSSPLV